MMGLEGPVRGRPSRWAFGGGSCWRLPRLALSIATAMRWRQKTRNACFSPDEPPARRAASSEVKRRLVEAPAILLGNGNEGVALGMDELVPTVNLFVGTGIGGRSWCRFRCVDSVQIDLGFKRKLKTARGSLIRNPEGARARGH